jgi:xanthine dehydrogenase accessory factor
MTDIFMRIAELRKEGKTFALATVILSEDSTPRDVGTRMIIHPDRTVEGTIGGGALEKRVIGDAVELIKKGGSERFIYDLGKDERDIQLGMICGGKSEVLIETFSVKMKIFIFGGGHVGKKLAEVCTILGLPYWVIDNRESYALQELFPDAMGVLHSEFKESFYKLPIDVNSYIIIVTYGHQYDGVCLEEAVKTQARYIGMIGSRSKVRKLLQNLSDTGVDVNDPRIYAPIGLNLGGNSPEAISISIISEVLKIESGGNGEHMRDLLE